MSEAHRSTPRTSIYLIVLVILVLAVGVFIGTRTDGDDTDPAALDERATAVREQLGDLCSSFDFQLKEEVGGGVVRPVHCKENGTNEIHLRLFVFTDDAARETWRSELLLMSSSHPERQEQVEFGEDWALISFDAETLDLAADRLRRQ